MSLVTRCPSCSTTFRVQPGQLAQRGGKVRCGKCNTVFDGLAALVSDADAAAELGPSPQLALFDPTRLQAEEAAAPPVAEQIAAAGADTTQPLLVTALHADAQAQTEPEDAALPADAPETPAEPAFLVPPAPRQRFSVAWALLALIALTGLVGQMLIHNRTEARCSHPSCAPIWRSSASSSAARCACHGIRS